MGVFAAGYLEIRGDPIVLRHRITPALPNVLILCIILYHEMLFNTTINFDSSPIIRKTVSSDMLTIATTTIVSEFRDNFIG